MNIKALDDEAREIFEQSGRCSKCMYFSGLVVW